MQSSKPPINRSTCTQNTHIDTYQKPSHYFKKLIELTYMKGINFLLVYSKKNECRFITLNIDVKKT